MSKYCKNCGTKVNDDAMFGANCGCQFQVQATADPVIVKKQKNKLVGIIAIGIAAIIAIVAIFGIGGILFKGNTSSIKGTYKNLANEEYWYVFEKTEKNCGTFIMYADGEREGDKYVRNEWEIIDDVLILNEGTEKYKIYKDCIVKIDKESGEPEDYDLIAPKGKKFDFEIYAYKFNRDGTYEVTGNTLGIYGGEYYRKGNVIYMNFPYGETGDEFYPSYYIYDNDHIINAGRVYLK